MRRRVMPAGAGTLALTLLALVGCSDEQQGDDEVPALNQLKGVDDASGSDVADLPDDPATHARKDGPVLGAVTFGVPIYAKPDHRSPKIGYLRVGTKVATADKAANFSSCKDGFYNILPMGFVCLNEGATLDMEHPLMKANLKGPHRDKPLPYHYAFLRSVAPRYYRIPTEEEQDRYESGLEGHLRSFKRLRDEWTETRVGANDVPIDAVGRVLRPPPLEPPHSTELERYGGSGNGEIPWYFHGDRKVPNVSSFKVPDYAVMTNRIQRHGGVALVDAFQNENRGFGLTTDLRLVPISKMLPGPGATFHGVELSEWDLPLGFVKEPEARVFERHKDGRFRRLKKRYAYGKPLQLTGKAQRRGKWRFVELENGSWMRTRDLGIVNKPKTTPYIGKKGVKWIDVSIRAQTLVLYEGTKPIFATLVSTGKDGIGDPDKTFSTPRGTFKVREKHVTHTMDSQVVGEEFELAEVPWVQYFHKGYALHAAYWHSDFGRPRSHGCINLAPVDAYRVFQWTSPKLPDPWHGIEAHEGATEEGTYVHVHW